MAVATSWMARPWDSKRVIWASEVRPGVLPDTTSPSSVTVSQFTAPRSAAVRRSPHSSWACSRESTVMMSDFRTASLSISLRTRELLPAALTWAPSEIHSPLTTGSREFVMVMITSAPVTASSGEGAGETSMASFWDMVSQKAARGSGRRLKTRADVDIADGANGLKLGGGLTAGADHADGGCTILGEVLGGYAGGCTGPHSAEVVGLDDGEEVSGVGAEEEDHESGAGAVGGIDLEAHGVAVVADAGHELHVALAGDVKAASGAVDGSAFALAAEGPFDGVKGVLHGEEPGDFVFADDEGQGQDSWTGPRGTRPLMYWMLRPMTSASSASGLNLR